MDVRMIAHDMRTPLNALMLSVQAAKSSATQEQKTILAMAEKNAWVLSGMIEGLLATTSEGPLPRGPLQRRECLALDLVTSAVDQVVPLAMEKNLTLETGPMVALPPLFADCDRVVRILTNLLTNAVKFTPAGGHVLVDAKYRVNDGHPAIVFSVADDGVGVSEEDVQRIFVEGISIASPAKQSTGLGLAVCKELVEAHGGRIWIESGRAQGSVFSFSIPTEKRPE